MYCARCGKEIKDEWKICPACGEPIESHGINSSIENKSLGKKKPRKAIIVTVVVAVLLVFVLSFGEDDVISDIKSYTLPTYSEEITIGDAFEDYFFEPRWTTYESDDADGVIFNGFIYSDVGDKIKVTMEMLMYEQSIKWQEVTLYNVNNGTTTYLTNLELESLLSAIYEGGTFSWIW